ncbi:MAG: hypothetical protein AVDCRST_MAG41-3755 [uncultured Corynebacteriales bacterium]|uniref:Uncharacterized protein n=1 Tax=uncultured Mycobacteriales bacterium TaxID=581187 RepID=A0A6J4JNP8_9ACTN|nr:MAG: hypothetical protein AVDCRST_MAG41-3755 [uncultured Corynebacteriales bacterium]
MASQNTGARTVSTVARIAGTAGAGGAGASRPGIVGTGSLTVRQDDPAPTTRQVQ